MNKSSKTKISVSYSGLSDVGLKRSENQDSYGRFPADSSDSYQGGGLLFMVADGMGGHENGKEASRLAVQIVADEYFKSQGDEVGRTLTHAIQKANRAIYQKASATTDGHQMGTTLSSLALTGNVAHIAHVGDSRVYLIREGKLLQLTTDHTKVEELKRAGILTAEEAKNHPEKSVLRRALGVKEQVRIDLSSDILVKSGDTFILCTDGLAHITKDELVDVVQSETPETACQKFIALANQRGGHDNSTVQIVQIGERAGEKIRRKKEMTAGLRPLWIGLGITSLLFLLCAVFIAMEYGKIEYRSPEVDEQRDRSASDEIAELFDEAQRFVSQDRHEEAINNYQQILMINPLNTDALRALDSIAAQFKSTAERYQQRGDLDEALQYYRKAMEIRLKDSELAAIISDLEKTL